MPAAKSNDLMLENQTSAILTPGAIYGLKQGAYQNDPEMLIPHDAIRHSVPDGVRVIRATGERTYVYEKYEPEEYDGNPETLTGVMPSDVSQDMRPTRGQRRPGDRMRAVPNFNKETSRKPVAKAADELTI